MKYYITAKRSKSETVYYTQSQTQGENMVWHALSMAHLFEPGEAQKKLPDLVEKFKGLTDWQIVPYVL